MSGGGFHKNPNWLSKTCTGAADRKRSSFYATTRIYTDIRRTVMRVESLSGIDPQLIERLESFCAFTMAHPRLLAARDQLMDAIDRAAPGSLVMLLGTTG